MLRWHNVTNTNTVLTVTHISTPSSCPCCCCCCVLVLLVCVVSPVACSPIGVLDWLGGLPFPAGAVGGAAQWSGVKLGEAHSTVPVEPKKIDPNNPPLTPQPGTTLSDSFHTTTLRRGIIAQKEFKNGTEIARVAFEQMFNYSSPMAPGV